MLYESHTCCWNVIISHKKPGKGKTKYINIELKFLKSCSKLQNLWKLNVKGVFFSISLHLHISLFYISKFWFMKIINMCGLFSIWKHGKNKKNIKILLAYSPNNQKKKKNTNINPPYKVNKGKSLSNQKYTSSKN